MNTDKLFIKFDDDEYYPLSLKYSAILGLSESYYHPDKMNEFGGYSPDKSQRNPVLTIICTDSTEIEIKDITIDEFMSTIENYCRVEAKNKIFNQLIIKRHATYNKQLAVKVVNVVDVCT